jgi:hypothetical protein
MKTILLLLPKFCQRGLRRMHPVGRLVLWLATAATATAQSTNAPPDRLSYQGYLVDANGNPLAPVTPINYVTVFRIWTASSGGTRLWTEQQTVTVDKGNFSVVLGEGTPYLAEARPLLSSVFSATANASDRYIGVNVTISGTPTEILPRLRLVATPYSFLAMSARSLTAASGGNVVTYANNRVEVTGDLLASGVVSGNGSGLTSLVIPAASVTSGTLADARLSPNVALRNVANAFTANQIISGGNLGLGTFTPGFPLTFADALGDKISLWGQSGDSFGFGIAPSTLQIHANTVASDIAFGYGSSATMVESMRIKGNGNVGIATANPNALLSLGPGTANTKLALWDGGPGSAFGLGIQASQFRLHVSSAADDFVFLNAPAGAEVMRVKGNGYVGIGTPTPSSILQLGSAGTTPDAFLRLESSGGNSFANGIKLRNFNDAYGWDLINQEREGTGLQADGFHIVRHLADATGQSAMFIDKYSGFVGIGTTTPRAALHVAGQVVSATGVGNYFNYNIGNGAGVPDGNLASFVVAYFDGDTVSSRSVFSMQTPTFSDARAKTVLGRSAGAEDLQTLDRLQVTDYRWIDQIKGPKGVQKKVIAQEVEKVLPNAVSCVRRPIPNLYQKAAAVQFDAQRGQLTLRLDQAHELQPGDRVQIYTDRGDLTEAKVLAVPATNTFIVAHDKEAKEAFVYGKWVDDFRVVDYDALFMLNVSATQELHRKLRAQETELEALRQALAELKSEQQSREARTVALEKLVGQLVRTAAENSPGGRSASAPLEQGPRRQTARVD